MMVLNLIKVAYHLFLVNRLMVPCSFVYTCVCDPTICDLTDMFSSNLVLTSFLNSRHL